MKSMNNNVNEESKKTFKDYLRKRENNIIISESRSNLSLQKLFNKKFNSKGYFRPQQAHCEDYLKAKHQTYTRYRSIQNKQNEHVYNLPEKIPKFVVSYVSCKQKLKKPVVGGSNETKQLKTVFHTIDGQKTEVEHEENRKRQNISAEIRSEKIIEVMLKKYLNRKRRILSKSEKGLAMPESPYKMKLLEPIRRKSNSIQGPHSHKPGNENEKESQSINTGKPQQQTLHMSTLRQTELTAIFRSKIKNRKLKTTIQ